MADVTQLLSQFLYSRLPQVGGSGGSASGVLTVSTTSAATIADTNETDLWTYSLPANTLGADGRAVRITAFGVHAATANTKTQKLYFGATAIAQGGGADNGTSWWFQATVIRSSATAQVTEGSQIVGGTTRSLSVGAAAETLANAITIKVTGLNGTAAANDIVFKGAIVEILN